MKKFFMFIVVVMACVINANAQERVNGTKYKFSFESKVLRTFDFDGWTYSEFSEEWKNVNYKSLQSVQLKKFEYNNTEYFIIDFCATEGYYKYPTIKEGFRTYLRHYSYLVNEEQYKSFINPNDYVLIDTFYYDYMDGDNDDDIIRHCIKLITEKSSIIDKGKIAIKRYKDVVRFDFFDFIHSTHSEILKNKTTLQNEYFEANINNWFFSQTTNVAIVEPAFENLERNILFVINKWDIRGSEELKLDEIVSALKENPYALVKISGYADKATGTAKRNKFLSKKRSEMVANYLINHGIDKSRIMSHYLGDSVNPFETPELNRVNVKIVK